ncbi:MAG: helix-turn-helix transcriptional regulator [Oscillospiraceae bacterium]|jgi:transcriptional regulator with XRE-family HTH domain|nr:helix-turn-helix transcriptional regulator [Oscillospiraceae bacterium]
MNINTILKEKKLTKYSLAKQSTIPYATVSDICLGKTSLENCSAATLYKLAKTLDVTMEELVADKMEYRMSFEAFKSTVCHRVHDMGDLDFIIATLESGEIRELYEKKWYAESLYLLAMTDYLSRENGLALCRDYADIRAEKLQEPVYPASIIAICAVSGNEKYKQDSFERAIPEFRRCNIVESEVRNVC